MNLFPHDRWAEILTGTRPRARGRRLSAKQARIIRALRDAHTITLDEAVRLIGGNHYCNARKHVGALLANMVTRALIQRVKPGLYRLHPCLAACTPTHPAPRSAPPQPTGFAAPSRGSRP